MIPRNPFAPHKGWIASLMVVLMLLVASPVWADACSDAKTALGIAREKLKDRQLTLEKAKTRAKQAKARYDSILIAFGKVYSRKNRASDMVEQASRELVSAYKKTNSLSKRFNTAAWQAYQAAKNRKRAAWENYNAATKATPAADKQLDEARKALFNAQTKAFSAEKFVSRQRLNVARKIGRVNEACKKKVPKKPSAGMKVLLDSFGMGGSDVIKEYTGRAKDANTEDIAIEEARKRGLDVDDDGDGGGGGGGATPAASTAVTGSVNCFGSPGQATVSFAGMQVCSSTGGIASVGNAISKTCTPGSTVSFVIACPGATAGPNCHMFVASLTGVTCTPNVVGIQVNGPGTVNCTCN